MYNQETYRLGSKRSVIRELFEYGKKRIAEQGAESVFDYSLGNPSIPAPDCVNEAIKNILDTEPSVVTHGYTSAQGDISVRTVIADDIKSKYGINISPDGIYMTCGAAASLTISIKAIVEKDTDEIIVFAPFFPEYSVFVRSGGATPVPVRPDEKFMPDFDDLRNKLNANTRAIIVNSPNNPSGVVYTEEVVKNICALAKEQSEKNGREIIIICDEPYREIVYDGKIVPYIMNYYPHSVVCYSFSKSLSLPGERIGYIAVNPDCVEERTLYYSVCGAGRALGYVCAPSLMQKVIARCLGAKTDVDAYKYNRDLLCSILDETGYSYVKPDGAFYLFIKTPEEDAFSFSERAKEFGLLLVPSDSFGVGGYVRASYCVSTDMIERSADAFRLLIDTYR